MTLARIITFVLLVCAASAQTYTGTVSRVTDGDTFVLASMSGSAPTNITIRLHGIDAPESKQAYGKESADVLRGIATNGPVIVASRGTDRYGRLLGRASMGGTDINLEMVKLGAAWHYEYYAKNDTALRDAQREAKRNRRGLWIADAEPVPPWRWRRKDKA